MSDHHRRKRTFNDKPKRTIEVFFDPSKNASSLLDELAEQQADKMPDRPKITKSQLRRVFGELKDIYNRFASVTSSFNEAKAEEIYQERFAAPFKMLRSKVAYATRSGGQSKMPNEYGKLFQDGIKKVTNAKEFKLYVLHIEAVVGFLYGKDKIGS
ncbi:MAG: type III-A CRISPR-associated protein Csm2 [Planctomycetes bacterium]|nr:type III-A CRISPR-associated protein Csm2 [Planctomycetota bacterium]